MSDATQMAITACASNATAMAMSAGNSLNIIEIECIDAPDTGSVTGMVIAVTMYTTVGSGTRDTGTTMRMSITTDKMTEVAPSDSQ